mmetsp:Transcript_5118/g.12037  ORF Transcript_5118/g.12037 Transcript_5118/m.12037 type:complete len:95 (-) Transcript_5118:219-503(-)
MSKTDALPGVTKGNQLTLEILPADDDENEDSRISVRSQPRRPTDYVKTLPLTQPSHLGDGHSHTGSTHGWMDGLVCARGRTVVYAKIRGECVGD